MALYPTKLTGKSIVPVWMRGGPVLRETWIPLRNITANATFVLPANCYLTGESVMMNTSTSNQAAVTIGTSAAGTQITAGALFGAGFTRWDLGTRLPASNADRTIYVESSAWNTTGNGIHVFMQAYELPLVADNSAPS